MFAGKSWEEWIDRYAQSHQNGINRLCHTIGIPLIAISVITAIPSIWFPVLRWPALIGFVLGWALQFVGHAFEGKPPEFFSDWRFLFVGLRWWWAKVRGLR